MESAMEKLPTRGWLKPVAKLGYAARGIVYLIVGLFAFLAAIGAGEEKDSEDALRTVLSQQFGELLVWCLLAGLASYVVWRLIQALLDADRHGTGAKALAIRAGLLASAVTYTTLAVFALSLLADSGGPGDGGGSVASSLATLVGSDVVATALSGVFAVVAGAHVWKAMTQRYAVHFRCDDDVMRIVHPVSMIGLTARGFVFAVIAILFFYRGLNAGESESTPGLKAALQFVQGLPFGAWLLGLLGLGLLAFSAYSFAEARWRHINTE